MISSPVSSGQGMDAFDKAFVSCLFNETVFTPFTMQDRVDFSTSRHS